MSEAASDAGFSLTLAEPITAHGEVLNAITLRRPKPADAREIKALPYWMGENGATLNTEAATKYIARLAAIPPSSVDQLDIADFNELAWAVAGFFLSRDSASLANSSRESTTSPGSGGSTPK